MRSLINSLTPVFWIAVIFVVLVTLANIPTLGRDPLTGIQFHRQAR